MLGELVAELVLQPLFELVGYATGKPIVLALSGGRLNVGLVEPDKKGKRDRRWYSLTFTCAGKRYVDPEAVALVGFAFWAAVIVGIVLVV